MFIGKRYGQKEFMMMKKIIEMSNAYGLSSCDFDFLLVGGFM